MPASSVLLVGVGVEATERGVEAVEAVVAVEEADSLGERVSFSVSGVEADSDGDSGMVGHINPLHTLYSY